ncbi:MAG TPA: fibrobacter succinogenes major paralogous domain-containing protein [Fibrobacteraceae bacterium]|nr:fibrobacter succinogenes major paralogous domain-containing protein [Fibrobacteraceae bacterium]
MTDGRDGQTYRTVMIGTQTWMAENLNYDTLNDTGSWCYSDTASYCDTYGRLYNWATAMGVDMLYDSTILGDSVGHRGVCPDGWHVPSSSEWQTLVDYAGGDDVAGTYLMANSDLWLTNSGTDDYGFSALPGGGYYGSFGNLGIYGNWWTATEYNSSIAYNQRMVYASAVVELNNYNSKGLVGFSLRCSED